MLCRILVEYRVVLASPTFSVVGSGVSTYPVCPFTVLQACFHLIFSKPRFCGMEWSSFFLVTLSVLLVVQQACWRCQDWPLLLHPVCQEPVLPPGNFSALSTDDFPIVILVFPHRWSENSVPAGFTVAVLYLCSVSQIYFVRSFG